MRPPRRLRDVELPPLSEVADETLRRAWALLAGVRQEGMRTEVIGLGYARGIHAEGVGLLAWVSGERPFSQWREWRVLRPPRDPYMPAAVAELEAFVTRWQPLAIAAVYQLVFDPDDQQELLTCVTIDQDYPSKTWRAKAYKNILQKLGEVPLDAYQAVARQLVALGLPAAVAAMEVTLARVQQHLRDLPVDADEARDIQACREQYAEELRKWLDARRAQLAPLGSERIARLGLGEVAPAAAPTEQLHLLATFSMGAEA